jgi:hypothetical protein
VIPRHKGSPRYQIAHGWKMRMDLLILKPWISSCTLENRGVHFTHTHIFFFLLFFLSFFHSFSHSFIFFFLLLFVIHSVTRLSPWSFDFLFAPLLNFFTPLWILKLHRTHLLSHA